MTDRSQMDGEEHDARIAEYALGTLVGAERTAFESELARDPALRREVATWAERLQPLADSISPVDPPAELRERVLRLIHAERVGATPERKFSIARWLGWTFGLSAMAAAVAVALVFALTPPAPSIGGYAALHDTKGGPDTIAFQVAKDRSNMVVLANVTVPAADKDFELWVVPSGGKPISLGVIKAGIRAEHPLPPATAKYFVSGATVAVSLEPAGGAPAGDPTGPIVYAGSFSIVKPSAPAQK